MSVTQKVKPTLNPDKGITMVKPYNINVCKVKVTFKTRPTVVASLKLVLLCLVVEIIQH